MHHTQMRVDYNIRSSFVPCQMYNSGGLELLQRLYLENGTILTVAEVRLGVCIMLQQLHTLQALLKRSSIGATGDSCVGIGAAARFRYLCACLAAKATLPFPVSPLSYRREIELTFAQGTTKKSSHSPAWYALNTTCAPR